MKVMIVRLEDMQDTDANILLPHANVLPSLTDGWRFNFKSNTRKEKLETYILSCAETPAIIEGCLSFKMRKKEEPYMAYVEVAPHNKVENKRYENVAACLIAFACRLSFIHGKEAYKGWLAFDVLEKDKNDEIKLMAVYSQKYSALRFGATTMVIPPEGGEKLIKQFLNR